MTGLPVCAGGAVVSQVSSTVLPLLVAHQAAQVGKLPPALGAGRPLLLRDRPRHRRLLAVLQHDHAEVRGGGRPGHAAFTALTQLTVLIKLLAVACLHTNS